VSIEQRSSWFSRAREGYLQRAGEGCLALSLVIIRELLEASEVKLEEGFWDPRLRNM